MMPTADHIVADHTMEEFGRARERALSAMALQRGAARLGVTPDELVWVADRCAAGLLGVERLDAGLKGATTALICGLLQALELVDPAAIVSGSLMQAMSHVTRRGPHAVIAAHCDLAAVACAARDIQALVVQTIDCETERGSTLFEALPRLFELGLAIGLGTHRLS